MAGYLLLAGGAEFGGKMAIPDRRAIELAGGNEAPIAIIPAAAAPDNNHRRAGSNGVNWFKSLGAQKVESVPVIDKTSANDPKLAERLAEAKFIYLLGGFTGYLGETLKDSLAWQACLEAYRNGAVIGGSSAGAMVMCEFYYDPSKRQVVTGLDLVPGCCVLPHHNTFGKGWANNLARVLPEALLLGLDERTAIIDDGLEGETKSWQVYGEGEAVIYRGGKPATYPAGDRFVDPFK